MRKPCSCKICNVGLFVEIDDEYASLGDPMKLLTMATCNRCYDIRERRQRAVGQILGMCRAVSILPVGNVTRDKLIAKFRPLLEKVTRVYAQTFTDSYRSQRLFWDIEFVNLLVDRPDKVGQILGKYQHDCREVLTT